MVKDKTYSKCSSRQFLFVFKSEAGVDERRADSGDGPVLTPEVGGLPEPLEGGGGGGHDVGGGGQGGAGGDTHALGVEEGVSSSNKTGQFSR